MRLPRKWINEQLDKGLPVQCAVTSSNACYWVYLTTTGKVCGREYGFVEDSDDEDETFPAMSISKATISSVDRLNRALANLRMRGDLCVVRHRE